MDLSKIPNSSGERASTPQPPPPPVSPALDLPGERAGEGVGEGAGGRRGPGIQWQEGPEAFLNGAVGLLICWFASRFFAFAMHKLTGGPFAYTFTDVDGVTPLSYPQTWFFIADFPVALAGLGMIWEAIAMGAIRRVAVAGTVVVWMGLAALANVGAFLYLLPRWGGQILPLLCAVLSMYVAWSVWNRLRE